VGGGGAATDVAAAKSPQAVLHLEGQPQIPKFNLSGTPFVVMCWSGLRRSLVYRLGLCFLHSTHHIYMSD
jgi:hypothetical protein